MVRYQRAFTLFEIMIALFIFAILGVLAAITLHTVIKAHQRIQHLDRQLMKLDLAMVSFERGVSHIVPRPIKIASGADQPAVMSVGGQSVLFSTAVDFNPNFIFLTPGIKRVGFAIAKHELIETIWPVLDPVSQFTKPYKKVLMNGVQGGSIQFVSQRGQTVSNWPQMQDQSKSDDKKTADMGVSLLPKAMEITLDLGAIGRVTRMVNLPGASRYVSG